MDRKVNVLGITLDNYFVEEAMAKVEGYMENEYLNTIDFVSTSLLLTAAEDEKVKQNIENMDLIVIGDKEILEAAGTHFVKRFDEIEKNVFMKAFFMYLSDHNKHVFLLVDTENQVKEFEKYLSSSFRGISLSGSYCMEERTQEEDDTVNEINSVSPDVIIAIMGSPVQESFVLKHKQKLNAKIWIGLGHHENARKSIGLKPSWLSRLVDKTLFKRQVSKYNSEQTDGD